jgi:hypothetical protein
MGKRFKGKTCVYCAIEGASESCDHVFAREFVPVDYRPQIPQAPACKSCNGEKSNLEHYLTAILPFGGRHGDAEANLKNDGQRRLAKNQRLHRELAKGSARQWSRELSGLLVNTLTIPIDGEKVEQLVGFITRGLMWHHWNVVLGRDCFVDVLSLTARGESFFARYGRLNARERVKADIGNGALVYEGAQGTDNPKVSVWQLSLFGGIKMIDAEGAQTTYRFGVMTGPQSVKTLAEERVKRGAFILPV